MSCIRFNTPAQRQQMRDAAPSMMSPEQAASLHPAPAVTESKIRRLRDLAASPDPKIRESVASSRHAPADVLASLSRDRDVGVRAWVARNPVVPLDILSLLVDDESETVRGWLAVNPQSPSETFERLASDSSDTVRGLVAWRRAADGPE